MVTSHCFRVADPAGAYPGPDPTPPEIRDPDWPDVIHYKKILTNVLIPFHLGRCSSGGTGNTKPRRDNYIERT